MRVIAGELRGRPLRAPEGRATRPTSGRVRESLFALLGDVPRGAIVLDLFAGSGALGIEALSRGAGRAVFVETDAAALAALRDNLAALGLAGRAEVRRVDAASGPALAGGPFDLVLADPPYGAADLPALVRGVAAVLAPDGVLALEQSSRGEPPAPPDSLALWKSRRYGDTRVALYVRAEPEPEGIA